MCRESRWASCCCMVCAGQTGSASASVWLECGSSCCLVLGCHADVVCGGMKHGCGELHVALRSMAGAAGLSVTHELSACVLCQAQCAPVSRQVLCVIPMHVQPRFSPDSWSGYAQVVGRVSHRREKKVSAVCPPGQPLVQLMLPAAEQLAVVAPSGTGVGVSGSRGFRGLGLAAMPAQSSPNKACWQCLRFD